MQPIPIDLASTGLTTTQWAAFAIAGAMTLYALVIRPSMKRKKDPLAKAPSFSSLAQQRNVERQMQNLLVELSEMARQLTAQLDTRTTKLALMIDDADEKAAMLQRLLDECRAALAAPPPPAAVAPVAPPASDPAAVVAPIEPSLALANEADARHQQVYALADEGRSAPDIARQIDRPRGEVELIIALRPRG
jgi:hypothetical protein